MNSYSLVNIFRAGALSGAWLSLSLSHFLRKEGDFGLSRQLVSRVLDLIISYLSVSGEAGGQAGGWGGQGDF